MRRRLQSAFPVPVSFDRGALAPGLLLGWLFAFVAVRAGLPVAPAWLCGAVGGTASLLVHELGHAHVAAGTAPGVRPVCLSLSWLGGSTRLEGAYANGRQQARVALAGPIASLWVATLLTLSLYVLPASFALKSLVIMLAVLNAGVAAVNLVPVSPLDGYKLVVGLLWCMMGSESAARRLARRLTTAWLAFELAGAALLALEWPVLGRCLLILAGALAGQRVAATRSAPVAERRPDARRLRR